MFTIITRTRYLQWKVGKCGSRIGIESELVSMIISIFEIGFNEMLKGSSWEYEYRYGMYLKK